MATIYSETINMYIQQKQGNKNAINHRKVRVLGFFSPFSRCGVVKWFGVHCQIFQSTCMTPSSSGLAAGTRFPSNISEIAFKSWLDRKKVAIKATFKLGIKCLHFSHQTRTLKNQIMGDVRLTWRLSPSAVRDDERREKKIDQFVSFYR
jgi:hypothetical protein